MSTTIAQNRYFSQDGAWQHYTWQHYQQPMSNKMCLVPELCRWRLVSCCLRSICSWPCPRLVKHMSAGRYHGVSPNKLLTWHTVQHADMVAAIWSPCVSIELAASLTLDVASRMALPKPQDGEVGSWLTH